MLPSNLPRGTIPGLVTVQISKVVTLTDRKTEQKCQQQQYADDSCSTVQGGPHKLAKLRAQDGSGQDGWVKVRARPGRKSMSRTLMIYFGVLGCGVLIISNVCPGTGGPIHSSRACLLVDQIIA